MATDITEAAAPAPELVAPPECLPGYDKLVTEDGAPVDGVVSEKQMRLLTEPLYSSWAGPGEGRPFLAMANVGLFYSDLLPAVVPDVLLSVDVRLTGDVHLKKNRSYFVWRHGKPPETTIEVVSNLEGEEDGQKLEIYAAVGVTYYVIWDPGHVLSAEPLRVFRLSDKTYTRMTDLWLPAVNLGLKTWHGVYEGLELDWLRWCDRSGQLIATGAERAEQERQRAEQEKQRAEQEKQRAEQERQRVERLVAQLRALGVDPTNGK